MPGAPQLGEAGLVRLAPQRHAPRLLGLLVEVLRDARLFDPPAGGGADAKPAQTRLLDERHHLVDRHAEDLGDLCGSQQAHVGRRNLGHAPIMERSPASGPCAAPAVDNRGAGFGGLRHDGVMTALDAARPRSRAFWGDARFFLGILLVVASVAGVWFVVSAARQTAPAFAANRTIVPGEAISGDDLRLVDVSLGQVGDAYLQPDALADGLVATRTIESGELVPQSAVGDAAAVRTTSVVLRSAVDVPGSVRAGSVVEVWAAPLVERGELRRAAHPGRRRDRRVGDARRLDDRRRLGRARGRDPARGRRRDARRDGRPVGALGGAASGASQ